MSDSAEYPTTDELEDLHDLLVELGEREERIENVSKMAALSKDRYDYFWEKYQLKKIQNQPVTPPYGGPYEQYPGELMLGTDPENRPVGISRQELNEHLLAVGRSGAGKTTFFYNMMDTLQARNLPFWVFDFKNDYRDVVEDFDLTVVNWQDLKFNPLQPPPGVSDGRWAEALAQTWAHAMGFMTLSKSYFLNKLRHLYTLYEAEIVDGRYPTLFELRDLAEADEGKIPYASPRYRAKERAVGRTMMLTGFTGCIFDCSRGYDIEALLERNVVFELQGPVREVQQFVVETLLTWLFYYREAQGHRQGLRHAVLFDEAKMVFDRQREEDTDVPHPPITSLMGRVREFGEALVVADHEPSKLSDSLKANTNVKLWLSLGSGHDTEEMAATFGVEDDEVDFTRTLERGQAVVKTAEREPIPVNLPPYHVDKTTDAQDIRERMAPVLADLEWRERVRPRTFQEVVGERDRTDPDTDTADADTEPVADDDVGEVAEQLLASVTDQPFLSVSQRYDAIDVGAKTGNTAKEELVALGLVREVEVDSKKPGRNPTLLELTAQGEQVLEDRGYDVAGTGRRGITHRYWQHRVEEYYEEEGFDVAIEHGVADGFIDVYAEQDGERVAVEVACSPEHEVENIQKCVSEGVDRIEVVYLEDRVKSRIETAVRDAFDEVPNTVVFVDAAEFA